MATDCQPSVVAFVHTIHRDNCIMRAPWWNGLVLFCSVKEKKMSKLVQ